MMELRALQFLLKNWTWVVPIAIAGLLALALGWSRIQLASVRAEFAEFKAGVADTALKTALAAREKESQWNAASTASEGRHADDQIKIADAAGRNHGLVAQLLRERSLCRNGVPKAANADGGDHGPDPGQRDVLPGQPESRLERRYREADIYLARLRSCRTKLMAIQ